MIKIINVSIENYRSIINEDLEFSPKKYTVIVGPNNSGKSNILRALSLFFNGNINNKNYDAEIDFPKSSILGNRAQTKITITLEFDPQKEVKLNRAIEEFEHESDNLRLEANQIRLRLEFSRRTNQEQWKFIGKAGLRSVRAELIAPVIKALRGSVRYKYLPVGRDISQTIAKELSQELITAIFSGWSGAVKNRREINETIETLLKQLQPRLKQSGSDITEEMGKVFSEIKGLELGLPFIDLETMLPSLIPYLSDNYHTSLENKGSGIQTSTLLFLLKYVADHIPQRYNLRITYIWAIEEPESYLHPSRQRGIAKVLQKFSRSVQTLITTHSPHFVPRDNKSTILVIDKSDSKPHSTLIINTDYEEARRLLGVTLLDAMYLAPLNIIVEGPSDEIILKGIWKKLIDNEKISYELDDVKFFPGNNANGACILFESFANYANTDEVKIALILDGDDAGKKALAGLLARYNSVRPLKSNKDYFQLDSTMEWLASSDVMQKLKQKHGKNVILTENTDGEITDFKILDGHKKKVAHSLVDFSDLDDVLDFEKLIERILETVK